MRASCDDIQVDYDAKTLLWKNACRWECQIHEIVSTTDKEPQIKKGIFRKAQWDEALDRCRILVNASVLFFSWKWDILRSDGGGSAYRRVSWALVIQTHRVPWPTEWNTGQKGRSLLASQNSGAALRFTGYQPLDPCKAYVTIQRFPRDTDKARQIDRK